jgi:ribonuclease-3
LGKDFVRTERLPTSILGTVFEAIIAAIYIDGGIEQARAFVMRVAKERIDKTAKEIFEGRFIKDFKSILQDYSQKKSNVLPVYKITKEEGLPHAKIFEAHVEVDGKVFGPGIGRTKKEAEQQAAKIAVEKLNIFPHTNKQPS